MSIRICPQVLSSTLLLGLTSLLALGGCTPPAGENGGEATGDAASSPASLDNDTARAGYTVGYSVAQNVSSELGAGLDSGAFQQGVADALAGRESRLTEAEAAAAMESLRASQVQVRSDLAAANLADGEAFLAENGAREGVVTTASGLQYEVITEGDGPKPLATDTVVTHYHGTLIDGTVFDSSVERGAPATFPLNRVIPGWTEGLQLMPVGSKWRLFVPPGLAYGERGAGADIGPNATLVFEVELLEIQGDS